ncbi:hypothetical protein [Streptomyces sp. Ag109_O5-10]|uniref:hypothetical protein n=1 Tax=Streptomyces sp. Ag109_O5-10 TaxID=1855349 RepID=UPI000894D76D|nr:hypothetical protein [Streptomyces sp. Ag109_O5-10]SEE77032.1 hypothetical protein SAMN05216533_3620 [Streptomyces sp. Ag109_O5-10]
MSAGAPGTATAPPSDYRLAVPEGWERIVLDPERWAHRIDKVVKRGLRRTKAGPQLEAALAERMREQAEAAHANGGVEMYVVNQLLGQVPVSAGLVVTLLRPAPGTEVGDLGDIARSLALRATAEQVTLVDLPAGPAVRHRYLRRPAADDPDGNRLAVTHLDVYLAVPNSDQRLLLSFSTPMEPLADALVGLFDAVARTLQWMA